MLEMAIDGGGGLPSWVTPTIAILTVMLGSGGFVAWRRLSYDKKLGVAQQEVAEDDALSNRWKQMIETQTLVLLEPMKVELASLKVEVRELRSEVEFTKRKYWSAVTYIRTLRNWIARHIPDSSITPPDPPANLAEDV